MNRPIAILARLAIAATIVASPAVVAANADAGPYAPAPVTVSTPHPSVGGDLHVVASGFKPGSTVQISIHSTPVLLATATADANGNVDVTVKIPTGFVAGSTHQIVASGISPTGAPVNDTVNVTLAGGGGALPFTGAEVVTVGVAGIALLGVGGFLVFAARWKRRTAPAE